jgi:hypothetical protein
LKLNANISVWMFRYLEHRLNIEFKWQMLFGCSMQYSEWNPDCSLYDSVFIWFCISADWINSTTTLEYSENSTVSRDRTPLYLLHLLCLLAIEPFSDTTPESSLALLLQDRLPPSPSLLAPSVFSTSPRRPSTKDRSSPSGRRRFCRTSVLLRPISFQLVGGRDRLGVVQSRRRQR